MVGTQNTSEQNIKSAEPAVLQVECDPSLKQGLKVQAVEAGFSSLSDTIRTLARDFVAGRIQYRGGILKTQAQIT